MGCEKYQKLISDWLDGNISQKHEKKLTQHLKNCAVCRSYYEELKILDRKAKTLPEPEYSAEKWEGMEKELRKRLEELNSETTRKHKSPQFWLPSPVWAMAGVLVIIVAISLMIFLKNNQEPEMQLAMMLSYEDSYLNLTQALAEDETLARNFNEELVNKIFQEIKNEGEGMISPSLFDYQEQNYMEIYQDNLPNENMILSEGI